MVPLLKNSKVNSCPDERELGAEQTSLAHYRKEVTDRAQWKDEKPADTRNRSTRANSILRGTQQVSGLRSISLDVSESILLLDSISPHLARCSPQVAATNLY
jgi:hypothetical protein